MRWPFRRKSRPAPPPKEDLDAALRDADRALIDAKQLKCRADDVTERLAKTWERNHISAAVARAIRGV